MSSDQASISDLPFNAQHVIQQFNRRPTLDRARFLLDEIAKRMLERLTYIKLQPKTVLDSGCGPALRMANLIEYYPHAQIYGLDNNARYIALAQRQFARKGLSYHLQQTINKFSQQKKSYPEFRCADMASTGLASQSMDLIWSNLALHWHPQPHAVIEEWQRLVRSGGLVMFSCFGPSTLTELRQAVVKSGWKTQMMSFVDMHDFGDLLLNNGFLDPVMDQEIITLTYKTPGKLLSDVSALGGNPVYNRHAGLMSRQAYYRLCEALDEQRDEQGLIRLSFEVAYGHAWRSAITRKGQEVRIAIEGIGRAQ